MHSLLYLLITLAILVVVHEFGHFWVARRCGVRVLKFSVGFGKALWTRTGKDGTEYVLAAIPLGGYVKMLDEREGEVDEKEVHRAFNRQPLSSRIVIVSAGPLANLLFAVFAYWLVFMIGIPGVKPIIGQVIAESPASQGGLLPGDEIKAINGEETATWGSVNRILYRIIEEGKTARLNINYGEYVEIKIDRDKSKDKEASPLKILGITPLEIKLKPVIAKVMKNSAAKQGGLLKGDVILAVDEQQISDWQQLVTVVQANPGKTLQFLIDRNGHQKVLKITPQSNPDGKGKIGVTVDSSQTEIPDDLKSMERYDVFKSLTKAIYQTGFFSWMTVKSLVGMLVGSVSSDNIGGPITIAQYAGASAEHGLVSFISFLAMISISLGLLNLLPVPVLDGGHLLMYLIEWLRGEPLSESMQMRFQNVGITLLLMLMFLAFFNDLTRLFGE